MLFCFVKIRLPGYPKETDGSLPYVAESRIIGSYIRMHMVPGILNCGEVQEQCPEIRKILNRK
jgi:hypothetical protein